MTANPDAASSYMRKFLAEKEAKEQSLREAEAARRAAELAAEVAAEKERVRLRKAEIRNAIDLAIAEGRIPGCKADYTVSLPRTGYPTVRTKLFPKLDLRVTRYDDYPHTEAIAAIEREIGGIYVGGGA
jgi:hypothetical protein